jgi:hypothetical protein
MSCVSAQISRVGYLEASQNPDLRARHRVMWVNLLFKLLITAISFKS